MNNEVHDVEEFQAMRDALKHAVTKKELEDFANRRRQAPRETWVDIGLRLAVVTALLGTLAYFAWVWNAS